MCFRMVTSDEFLQVLISHFQSLRTYFRKVPLLALYLLLAKASVNGNIWRARSLSGWAWADPVLGSYLKVSFHLLPFSICQQASHLIYAELGKWGLGLARRDGWPQPPGSGRKGGGAGPATLRLCVRGPGTLAPKGCLSPVSECCLPTNIGSSPV